MIGGLLKRESSLIENIIAIFIVTVVALVSGYLLGGHLVVQVHDQLIAAREVEDEGIVNPIYAEESQIVSLNPIVTNLLSSSENWIRIESSLVVETAKMGGKDRDVLAKEIEQDLLVYARTLGPRQLEGSRGLLRLRDDLNERARMRGGDAVHELILESVVIQ
ncbi:MULTISPECIES: flagellar basal body-associated FliL family protein [Pseudovibrio]|uniref:flagellar basal body-associated FliL family protein n=1 Tax=Stappiaceae TaxID=2821832 RepID=UPI0023656386|nr:MULTISPECIES: flagellar basal body-associated FliL family protein [Pseudovibrio]MDD7909012.1 flagellar basal body-associated FliL family protein [Pseudovibrio exalbescens]MDX5593667.1 flagellar basal body-associated FliL family protein [Pseudovibrio sp. SPO723]